MGGRNVAHGGVDSSNHAGEEVTVNVTCSNGSKFSVQVCLESTVEIFKSILAQKCEIPFHQQRVIYRGRILKDDQTLQSYGLEAGHTVHLVRSLATETAASTDAGVGSFFPGFGAGFNEGGPLGPGFISTFFPGIERNGMRNFSDIYEHVREQFAQNPNLVSDFFNAPSVRNIMTNNPEFVRNLVLSNSQQREIMDRNPGVVSIFNDPTAFRHVMDAARYPEIVHEVMGNTARARNNTPAPNINPHPNRSTSDGTGGMQTNLDTQSGSTGNLLNMANSSSAQCIHHLSSTGMMQPFNSSLLSQHGHQTSQEPGEPGLNAEGTAGTADNMGLDTLTDMFRGLGTDGDITIPIRPRGFIAVPHEELYATELSQLQEMGFIDKQENIRALVAAEGNVIAAVDRLTGNSTQ